jgi:hypothetical protein
MDKQTLKKHHFWILLALSVPLVFVVLAGTVFGVGSAAVEAKSKIDKRNKELTDAAPKCQQYLDNLELQKGELEKQRNRVWSEVYKAQAGLIHWPARLARLDRAYFGDKVAEDDRAIFRENDVYLREYEELPAIIAPTKFAGNGWNAVLRYRPSWNTLPTSEDCWLAIEDLCVQREILEDIHNVNQLLARFLPVPQLPDETGLDDKKKQENKAAFEADKVKVEKEVRENLKAKDDEIVARFISPYWTLDLAVTRGTGTKPEMIFRGKLTNHTDRRQNVAKVNFHVWLSDPATGNQPVNVPVQSEFVAAGETIAFDDIHVTTASRASKIFAVEQVLDLRYAPVKRVERLVLGYEGHRYGDQKLVAPEGPAFKEAKDAEGAAPADPIGKDPLGRGDAGGRNAGPKSVSANGLERDRYLHRTEQVRRMPIGVVLIVDEAHVQDVQRAFANSHLRFQNVQFHWTRYRGGIDLGEWNSTPTLNTTGPMAGGVNNPRGETVVGGPRNLAPAAPSMGPGGPGGPPLGPVRPSTSGVPSTPSTGPGAPGAPSSSAGTETMPSLVELTVYGIASLYERFPPRPAQPPGAPTGAPTGAPPAPAGTPPAPPSATGQPAPPTPPVPPPSPPDKDGL